MLDSVTLYYASAAMMAVMTLLNYLTWRTNKKTPGTLLYIFYPLVMFASVMSFALHGRINNIASVGIANTLLFSASIIHVLAICQFLNAKCVGFKTFIAIQLILLKLKIVYTE